MAPIPATFVLILEVGSFKFRKKGQKWPELKPLFMISHRWLAGSCENRSTLLPGTTPARVCIHQTELEEGFALDPSAKSQSQLLVQIFKPQDPSIPQID